MKLLPYDWTIKRLNEVCSDIIDCINKTAPTVEHQTPYNMIRTTNIRNGQVSLENVRYVDQATFEKWTRRVQPRRNDVILTREAPLGEVGLLRSDEKVFLGQRTMLYRANGEDLNQFYLFYSFQGYTLQSQIKSLGSGSTVEHLRVPHAETLTIPLPPITAQKKIAAVLSAYDDLIENNKRRIALLEKIAEKIYREWFVRFRFPGHEKVKFVKGVPDGWEQKPSTEVLSVLSGGTPKTNVTSFWGSDVPFFTPKDASDQIYVFNTEKSITKKGLDACNSRLYKKNTIFITARGTVGKIVLSHCDMAMNQSCYALLPKKKQIIYFYFFAMKNAISYIKGVSKSGVFDNIIIDTFKIIPLLMPQRELIAEFNDKVAPIIDNIGILLQTNSVLGKTRDRLLPRLISGKLSVEDLDIQFPPSMLNREET